MATDTFRASVKYGDWKGTAAADDAGGECDLASFLESKGLYDSESEFLLAVELDISENHRGIAEAPIINALIIEWPGNHDSLIAHLKKQTDPISVRRVPVELTTEEFIGVFKRISVVLLGRDLGLDGREYCYED